MSIVALKRKTAALYGPHAAQGGFSLNGSARSIGPGETSLGRSVTRTPFRGALPMGHGGGARCRVRGIRGRAAKCNSHGDYPVQIHNSGSCCMGENVVHRSTMNTAGMLSSRFKGILHGAYPNTWVKPAGLLTSDVVTLAANKVFNPACPALPDRPAPTAGKCNFMGYSKFVGPLNYTQYMLKQTAGQVCKQPHFPFRVNQVCGVNYTTVEQARAAGLF